VRGGSWPPLIAASLLFVLAFVGLRWSSGFLALAAERPAAEVLATAHQLDAADVLALRAGLAAPVTAEAWQAAVATFAKERARLGEPLAAIAARGDIAVAERARAAAADADAAWRLFRVQPEAWPGLQFLGLRERFATRAPARD
jgi:hypothetical protein